jgi:hypothetical protein
LKRAKRAWFTRRTALLLWGAGWFWLAVALLIPVSLFVTRAGSLALIGLLYAGTLALWWHIRWLRWSVLTLGALITAFFFLPGREDYDRFALRAEAARCVERYEGTRYAWRGEGRFGVDCSGLVRRGIIEGLAWQGLTTVNPHLLRLSVAIWWRDLSPKEMADGSVRTLRKVCDTPALDALKDKNLHMGDFALTRDGAQVLAYVGEHVWMEADPEPGKKKVIRLRLGKDKSAWFQTPVDVLRWRCLELPRR